jgi:Rhomboid family.
MVRVVLIIVLVALQVVFGIPGFMQGGPYWERALLYSFFHANWWHLAVNGIAAISIFAPSRRGNMPHLLSGYIIAVLVYPLSFRPVIGFSNVLYAVLGLRTPSLKSGWWKRPEVITFLVVTIALIFAPRFSATTHIAAFILGMAGASVKRFHKDLTSDFRRYL